jgi:hypothetical protein
MVTAEAARSSIVIPCLPPEPAPPNKAVWR